MKYKIIIIYFFMLTTTSLNSCSLILKNHSKDYTSINSNKLLKKYDNVFYISSFNDEFGIIWSYYNDSIFIYESYKNKLSLLEKSISPITSEDLNWSKEDLEEFTSCLALDSELIGFRVKSDSGEVHFFRPVNIECVSKMDYSSKLSELFRFEVSNILSKKYIAFEN